MKKYIYNNVLCYRLSALGDVAMTIPAIYSCAKAHKQTTFHVVTTAFCAQLFIQPPANVVIHKVEKNTSTLQLLRMLSGIDVDAVADMHNVLRSWLADLLFVVRRKRVRMLNKKRENRRAILLGRAKADAFAMRYFDVMRRLGLDCQPTFTSLFDTLPQLPIRLQKGSEHWIGVAPFARYTNKTYPLDYMQQVVSMLAGQPGIRVFLFGGRGHEAEMLQHWADERERVMSVAGSLPLGDELKLMAHLDIMLTMDSSNMHLASLVDIRVVSVWGSTTPACGFLGYGQRQDDCIYAGLSCQPCTIAGSEQCRLQSLDCMKKLPPERIVSKIIGIIK